MNAQDFLQRARAEISTDPKKRLGLLTRSYIEDPNCVIDVHAHIFDRKCLTIAYILLRMLKTMTLESLGIEAMDEEVNKLTMVNRSEQDLYQAIEKIKADDDADWDQLERELEKVIELNETYELFGYDLKDALRVLRKKDMREVLDYYIDEFSIVNLPEFEKAKLVTVVLQMDLETGWNIRPKRDFLQQVQDLKDLTRDRAVLPFLAIDPRRVDNPLREKNLYDIFLDVFTDQETPFFGIKCYPALGYQPTDIRLDPIFEICAEKNIPVLTHCGGTIVSTYEPIVVSKNEQGYFDYQIPGNTRKERADALNRPENWIPVLNKYPGLKLDFGHFGGDDNWLEFSQTGHNQRVELIIELIKDVGKRVWADFSFNVVEDNLFDQLRAKLDGDTRVAERALFGTDYWVVLPAGALMPMQEKFFNKMGPHTPGLIRDNILNYLFN